MDSKTLKIYICKNGLSIKILAEKVQLSRNYVIFKLQVWLTARSHTFTGDFIVAGINVLSTFDPRRCLHSSKWTVKLKPR